MAGIPPPLQPGWTEHVGPQGQLYWYNAALQQSTYARPTLQPAGFGPSGSIPVYTGPPPPSSSPAMPHSSSQTKTLPLDGTQSKPKKEKPAKKEPIVGAEGWLRVTTTLGNIFYTHKESKRSEWTVPDEIKEQVEVMQEEERRIRLLEEEEERLAKEQLEEERRQAKEEERQRRLKEEEEARRKRQEEIRIREEAVKRQREERERVQEERRRILEEQGKRKRQEEEQSAEMEEAGEKKARLEEKVEDDEEAWQREMAAEMAAEVERQAEASPSIEAPAESETSKLALSMEENKALFMHMLTALNGTSNEVNPMAPWDRELPKFIHHRDYTVLSTLRDRQDAFNEWCKLRLREKRNKGVKLTTPAVQNIAEKEDVVKSESNGHEQIGKEDAAGVYRTLLETEVTSTRTKWEDFKKAWRKDRRFFAFGRDDREREKAFRHWLKELGEKKRKAAQEAEDRFVALLEEKLDDASRLQPDATVEEAQAMWTRAKRAPGLDRDARYEAVGSSSRRAEVFAEWAKGQRRRRGQVESVVESNVEKTSKDGTDRALREREEAVQRKRQEMESQKRRAFGQATREESLTSFQQLLVDAVRDPLKSSSEAMRLLSSDGRFEAPGLGSAEKGQLVDQHIDRLNEKRLRELHGVFEKYAPTLDVEAEVALPLIKDDDEIQRRHLDEIKVLATGRLKMRDLFDDWRQEKEAQAAVAFQQMLKENAFVQFWGGLRQEHEQRQKALKENGQPGARQGEDEEDDDEPDLLQMAGNVDLEEIHSILRVSLSAR